MPARSFSPRLGRQLRNAYVIDLPELSGGLNVRDLATELSAGESPDLLNVVFDERGGVQKRLGYTKWNASAAANPVTLMYWSSVAGKLLHYTQADGKLYSDPGTGVLTLRRTWTSGSAIGITDFAGKVYAIHPVDGLFSSSDGVTWTAVTATSGTVPKGSILAAWQNKLWVAGDSADPTNLYFCSAGDPTKWSSAAPDTGGNNHIREGNDFPIVCLFGAGGVDQQTKPSLLVGKRSGGAGSLHRVTDAATGDYVTLDQTVGPAGPNAITSLYGRVYFVSTSGIFETDGFATGAVPVGAVLEPLFRPDRLDYTKAAGFCAVTDRDRVRFDVATSGASGNDTVFEYYPLLRAFTKRSDASACYANYKASGATLLGASPSATGQIYQLNTGGSDDGTAIQSYYLSSIFEPLAGYQARLQRVRLKARAASLTVTCLSDFNSTGAPETIEAGQGDGFVWGTGAWGTGAWGSGSLPEDYAELWPRLYGRAFQLRFDETSTTSDTDANGLTIGAWALAGLSLSFNQLSID